VEEILRQLLGIENLHWVTGKPYWDWTHPLPRGGVVLVVVPSILLLFGLLYRAERRDVRPAAKVFMTFLRCLIVLLVVAMLCGPTLKVETKKGRRAFIGVLVDDSLSMTKPDRLVREEHLKAISSATGLGNPDDLSPDDVQRLKELPRAQVVRHLESLLPIKLYLMQVPTPA
jgi:hypothetical protein